MEANENQKVYNKLHVPFEFEGKLIEYFSAREVTPKEINDYLNSDKKQNIDYIKWVLDSACVCLDSLGDYSVNSQWVANKRNTYPRVLLAMPIVNFTSILIGSHIETFENLIEEAPSFDKISGKPFLGKVDLLENADGRQAQTASELSVDIELKSGYFMSDKLAQRVGTTTDNKIELIGIRIPTLEDAYKVREHYGVDENNYSFQTNLLGRCLYKAVCVDGTELPDNIVQTRGIDIISGLSAKDIREVIKGHNKIKPVNNTYTVQSDDDKVGTIEIDSGFLFSLA
ncbi:hypothetical protein M1M30_gp084 [Maribacter phage Colly_1]|uniref:Uncharacterized protein n=1 Tax=Maribacter phage Colly_1 TaxID=2745691 RepID=A0A8E4UY45_9CAUD|nr:hypothetical protein M1M30_gp084 [Maribacter phage Colly_1]QQO97371.1 hypothetical protein Colly1_84 [Maribacter phage Colly_1]